MSAVHGPMPLIAVRRPCASSAGRSASASRSSPSRTAAATARSVRIFAPDRPMARSVSSLAMGMSSAAPSEKAAAKRPQIASALAVFAYVSGHAGFAKYLGFPLISGAGELAVLCGAMAGAGLAFLWFNAYPAEVFMGDVGALALGAALGMVALVVRQEIVLLIMGGVFVVETLSVMLQVASFKLTGKRIFRMAPLHHHYELKGWKENQVVVRFWIITMMLVLVGLSTLKLR